jgi:hypothetical protein
MGYITEDEVNEFGGSKELKRGQKVNVVLDEYAPFFYGENKDKKMPKHLGHNADTGEELEFVGFDFHEKVGELNDDIVPGSTVLEVECVDNDAKFAEYNMSVWKGGAGKSEDKNEEVPF